MEVSKAIWGGIEHTPKTEAGLRSICISQRLGAELEEYLAGRADGYLFQTSTGDPWDTSLARAGDELLERLGIAFARNKRV